MVFKSASPSFSTISLNIINILHRLKNDFEAIFALHTPYTLFGWLPAAQDYIVFNSDWVCVMPVLREDFVDYGWGSQALQA